MVKPVVLELAGERFTLFPDVAYVGTARFPAGWFGLDEDLVAAAIRERIERDQRAETEELERQLPGSRVLHFPGGSVVYRPMADGRMEACVYFYGITAREGVWKRLQAAAGMPAEAGE